MKKLIVIFCLSLLTLSMQAASIYGIRIESDGGHIIVFVDGQQVCTPTTSCFIANLNSGLYKIEVFESSPSHHKGPGRKGELLFRDRIHYSQYTMKDISVRGSNNVHPTYRDNTMSPETFAQFLRSLKKQSFDDDRDDLMETAIMTSDFTSEQCIKIARLYTFDKGRVNMMKTVYPRIIDKQNFFMVIETLTFKMDKDQMNEFVKEYHQR